MMDSDTFRRMWSTTFRGAIECENMFITEITLNKTIRYNVKLLVSRCSIYDFQHSLFEHTYIFANFKNMTYSLNYISVLLCTQWVYSVWVVVMGVTSLADFQSTSLFSK